MRATAPMRLVRGRRCSRSLRLSMLWPFLLRGYLPRPLSHSPTHTILSAFSSTFCRPSPTFVTQKLMLQLILADACMSKLPRCCIHAVQMTTGVGNGLDMYRRLGIGKAGCSHAVCCDGHTWSVPSGVCRNVPSTRMEVPVDVSVFNPPTSPATSVLTKTCTHVKPKFELEGRVSM